MDESRLRRLSFRAWRRGFKEMDLILGRFADARLGTMSEGELDLFEVLLEIPDQELYAWLVGREPVPPEHDHALMGELRAFGAGVGEASGVARARGG